MSLNKAVRLHGKQDLRIDNLPIPEPAENHVQVKMSSGGLCRTDIHIFEDGQIDGVVVDKPIILGHEISGTVSKLGPGVTSLAVGDRVAIDPLRPCGHCVQCKKPRVNTCVNMVISGVMEVDGGFANYMTTPASTCHKLPENVNFEEGALVETVSVGFHAARRARLSPGEAVIVTGAGPVGLFTMQVAKALGASKVMMVDINEDRLRLASKLGADIVFKPTLPTSDPKAASEELKATFGGEADLFIECSGAPGILDVAIHTCPHGGRVMMIGFGTMAMHAHVGMAGMREIDILGAFASNNNFPEAIELVASGKVDVKSAITHRLPMDKFLEAMELMKSGKSVKIVLDLTS